MAKHELTKVEALQLLAPVVDNEATDEERKAFMNFIAHNAEVRNKYESMKSLKAVIGSRSPRVEAPASLKQFVKQVGQQEDTTANDDDNAPIYDLPIHGPAQQDSEDSSDSSSSQRNSFRFVIGIAASFLLAAAAWSYFNFGGKFVEPTIATASLGSAEIQMANNYDMSMTIPSLKNAEFKGVVYSEFVPGFEAPMLEYHLPSQDQYIYIFAFQVDKLKEFGQLIRHKEAVDKCNKPKDFHVRNVNGKHVVSWKWNNIWYAAISNHDGNTLASLVQPLQYDLPKN